MEKTPLENTFGSKDAKLIVGDVGEFIRIPQMGVNISTNVVLRGADLYRTLEGVKEMGRIPRISEFVIHYGNLRNAAKGKIKLYYADGTKVDRDEACRLWGYVSSTKRDESNGQTFWTRLNAQAYRPFFESKGKILDATIHIRTDLNVVDRDGKKIIEGRDISLEESGLPEDLIKKIRGHSLNIPLDGNGKFQDWAYEKGTNEGTEGRLVFYAPKSNGMGVYNGNNGNKISCEMSPDGSRADLGTLVCLPM